MLLRETGKTVLQHSIERALAAATQSTSAPGEAARLVWVACDDPELARIARACGIGAVLVTEPCASGTERIWHALQSLPPAEVIVNLQADEPQMPADWIAACAGALTGPPRAEVATVAVPLASDDRALDDPNAVKVVLDHHSCALYFSRSCIPHVRQGGKPPQPRALRHIGIYAYSREFLTRYPDLPRSDLEQGECLEQLRFLQAGARIRVLVRQPPPQGMRGIDTVDDYREFVARSRRAG